VSKTNAMTTEERQELTSKATRWQTRADTARADGDTDCADHWDAAAVAARTRLACDPN
jgi:hypothetical protein